ncbi:MAG: LysR family transcriptional regulator [Proteobacteria bacterium]|jgi:DNA-binding transcriptional LysR family regulator|nr:LysR family transcriptional regulator [Pseudomonadota bacterium]MDA1301650.1 LysR family transcriptional regulator [Pseudomonadota bacterium]
MLNPRISLEQWRAFVAVVEAGGYAQAAEQIHKTQSSVSYAVQKIESLLDLSLFEKEGRRAALTAAGQALFQRARNLLERADALEQGASFLGDDWDPELRLAVDIVYPTWSLLASLNRFSSERPKTRVQLFETVLGGTDEALYERAVDLAISSSIPQGFNGDVLIQLRFVAAAHPDHPLHQLGRKITLDDLREHRHLVVRDNAVQYVRESGFWLGADQRWTVSNKATQIAAACMGMGFAWFPEDAIRRELQQGSLQPLPLREGGVRYNQLYLVFADPDFPTASAVRVAEILREDVSGLYPQRA